MLIYKNKLLILFSTIILISGSLILFFSPPQIINKFQHGSSLTGDSARQKIRNFSYYAFKSNPVLGIGFGNFNKLALIDIKQAVVNDNKKFNANEYMPYSHAHNIFYTTLVEGGLCLFFIFLLFWCHIIQIIGYLTKQSETAMWLLWSATGVILINLGIGLVNTTLHHEHAIFSMFLLGLLISNYRKVLDLKNN